jgi:hypothetical protein
MHNDISQQYILYNIYSYMYRQFSFINREFHIFALPYINP